MGHTGEGLGVRWILGVREGNCGCLGGSVQVWGCRGGVGGAELGFRGAGLNLGGVGLGFGGAVEVWSAGLDLGVQGGGIKMGF